MRYTDTWKRHIPPEKLTAYKQLIDEGVIRNQHVLYALKERITVVEYDSELNHQGVLNELKKRSE